jgi:hypothetical protein
MVNTRRTDFCRKNHHRYDSGDDSTNKLDTGKPDIPRSMSFSCYYLVLCRKTLSQISYLMFHWVTGIPFENALHGGAYDDLTMWEQIDGGEQYTPAKKWLFSVPVVLYVF